MLSKIETKDLNIACPKKRLIEDTKLWTMHFGGGFSTAGEMIISPKEKLHPFAYYLELEFTQVEKEALLLGLKNYKDMGIELLCVKGDVELIDEPIKGYF